MVLQTITLQIAALDLEFVEVRAREEDRLRAAAPRKAGSPLWARIGHRVSIFAGKALRSLRPAVMEASPTAWSAGASDAVGLCRHLVCPEGYVLDRLSCTCRPVAGASS